MAATPTPNNTSCMICGEDVDTTKSFQLHLFDPKPAGLQCPQCTHRMCFWCIIKCRKLACGQCRYDFEPQLPMQQLNIIRRALIEEDEDDEEEDEEDILDLEDGVILQQQFMIQSELNQLKTSNTMLINEVNKLKETVIQLSNTLYLMKRTEINTQLNTVAQHAQHQLNQLDRDFSVLNTGLSSPFVTPLSSTTRLV